jgi:peptidoglycan/LPS O-acetylase OafA/YrhL
VTTLLALMFGFLAVGASAVMLLRRGRPTAVATVVLAIPIAAALAAILDGREGVHQAAIGWLLGVPMLVAAVVHRSRQELGSSASRSR